jgi:protein-tyrosine kinase
MKSLQFQKFPELTYAVTESINTLCTNLTFTGSKYKKIMVTSVSEAEGKSFLSMEILRTMAELGKRIILVDADLRRSNIATKYDIRFNSNNNLGVTHYLAGKCQLDDILYATDYKRAYFVPVGYCVSNSLALLNSPKLQELLEQLAMQADYVLVDSPPVGMIVDASEIAKSCEGAIFAVSYNQVHRRDLFEARQQIERSGCTVLGAVLNDVPMNVYNKRKYIGNYGRYGYSYVPVKNPGIDSRKDEEKVETR